MNKSKDSYRLPAQALLVLGLVDLLRGFMHTFNIHWAAVNIAGLNLSVAGNDQLFLLGTFGISNFLTGFLFIYLSQRARQTAPYVLIIIPAAYAIGTLGFIVAGLHKQAAFNGLYIMLVYLASCVLIFIKFLLDQRRIRNVENN
ncbi:hypothetical protein SDC9_103869 [bioreactor metagenome]|uniref:Uncharacterized protein n=1 Tax=bioreactor metagenome TaxID=1076179 RepID=A0A645AXM5_9ZZZZ